MENQNFLAKNLKAYLKLFGMSYAKLAEKAHLSRTTVYNIVNGKGYRGDSLAQISKALGVPVSDLLSKHFDPSRYGPKKDAWIEAVAVLQRQPSCEEKIERLLMQLDENERASQDILAQIMAILRSRQKGKEEV